MYIYKKQWLAIANQVGDLYENEKIHRKILTIRAFKAIINTVELAVANLV